MFTTYSASAGSGKTTHLVADYIALCFKYDALATAKGSASPLHLDSYRRILAITFTNAATAEMKDRIVRTLKAFAFNGYKNLGGSEKAIYNLIVKKLYGGNYDDGAVSKFMQQESLELLRRILFDYARFSVSTIDSFNQRTIRSSALSLDLNLNYSVQLDLYEFCQLAIDQMLNSLQADSDLSGRILYLIDNEMEDAGKANIDRNLQNSLNVLYKNAEQNYEYLKTLYATVPGTLQANLKQMKGQLKSDLDDIIAKIKPIAQEGNQHIQAIKDAGLNFHRKTIEKWFNERLEDTFGKSCEKTLDDFKDNDGNYFRKKKLTAEEQGTADNEMPEIGKCMTAIRSVLEASTTRAYRDNLIRSKNGTIMLMLKDMKEKMDEIKKQRNFFILSEANTLLCEKIEELGFETIFDRVRYENFFIDEFQDTSAMQWKDLKPLLINNALSSGHDVSLFGDVKQAIYRFRSGDSELFYNLIDENRFKNDKELAAVVDHAHYNPINLDTNYRSLRSVVDFNNKFFGFYAHENQADNYYKEGLVQVINQQEEGLVQICFCDKDNSETTDKQTEADDNTAVSGLLEPKEADVLREIITTRTLKPEELEVLYAVKDARNRGYHDGDIAVLFRGNDDCTNMANIMLALGWNVVTPKSLLLDNSSYVNLIILTIQCLLNPSDSLAQFAILHSISRLFPSKNPSSPDNTDEDSEQKKEENSNWEQFNGHIKERLGRELSMQWLSQPLYILVQKIMSFYDMHKLSDPFLTGFENLVLDYTAERNGEPADFLLWWQMLKDNDRMPSLTLPAGQDAIRINTIHKSKGLEYPVVILPYSEYKQTNKVKPFWDRIDDQTVAYINLTQNDLPFSSYRQRYDQELLYNIMDTENLLYVAHTRARDMLYIITSRSEEGNTYGDILSRFVGKNPSFTQAQNASNRYYAGDLVWGNTSNPPVPKHVIVPAVTASAFSIDGIFSATAVNKEDGPRTEGTVIHDFLSQLEKFPQDEQETEQVLEQVDSPYKERLRRFFGKIQDEEKWRELFFPASGVKVFNEYNIIDTDGKEHRPDRIVFLDGRTVVIDYKTGAEHEEHRTQVENYCQLLRDMGYPNVSGELLYF